nr:uncharacterized protein LOC100180868 isoform X1 [Ciona intestinalis]|eukprot:XP_018672956.1 uncharacterized protein LOC100180868 isoform X1 [Ciona intestinalis]
MWVGRLWICHLLLLGLTDSNHILGSKADKEQRSSTCPIICQACAADHLKGYLQVKLPHDQMKGCSGRGMLEKRKSTDTEYVERHIIHVNNNQSETIYLSFHEMATASLLPPNSSSITIERKYKFALMSTKPISWVIQGLKSLEQYQFYVSGKHSSIVSYDTGENIPKSMFDLNPSSSILQLYSTITGWAFPPDVYDEDKVTSFTSVERANFIKLQFGDNVNQSVICEEPDSRASDKIFVSYLVPRTDEGCVGKAVIFKPEQLVYAVQVTNKRSSTQIVLQLEGLSFLTESQKLTLVLRNSHPVEWKLIGDFGTSVSTHIELVVTPNSTVETKDLNLLDQASATIVINSNPTDISSFSKQYPHLTSLAVFNYVNFIKVKLKQDTQPLPDPPDASEINIFLNSLKPSCCGPSYFCLNLTLDEVNREANLLLRQLVSFNDCPLLQDADVLYLRARVGECGVRLKDNAQMQTEAYFDLLQNSFHVTFTCNIPKIQMQAYPDYERNHPIKFPLSLQDSEPRRNIFIEISADTDEDAWMGVHLDECSITKHQHSITNSIQLISGNCPTNQHVSFMVPHTNMHKQTFTFPSSMLDDVGAANFTVECCAFLCSSIANQYPKCANEHGMNCRNAQPTNSVCREDKYNVGPFLHVTTSTQTMILEAGKEESKEMKIELKYMLAISFGMFLVGVILVFTLCKIRQHYKRVPRRVATEQDQCLLNNKCSYTHASSQSESGEISRQTLYVNVNNRSNKITEKECLSGKSDYMGLYHISPLVSSNYTEKHIVEVVGKGKQDGSESPLLGTSSLEHRNCRAIPSTGGKSRGHADDTSSADSGVPVEPDKSESSSVTSQTAAQIFVSNLTDMKEETV